MTDIKNWLNEFSTALNNTFGDRVWFVGLQGSYARSEATKTSDIDMVVILDKLNFPDIEAYNKMLDTLSHRELICGFVSGKNELLNWDSADLFQFYYDTKPLKGSLDDLLPLLDNTAINRAIKTGVCNIYHGCVHNMLFDKNEDILKSLYKSASFVIRAIHFKTTGNYVSHQEDLSKLVSPDEQVILDIFYKLKNNEPVDFNNMSETLFIWLKKWVQAQIESEI